MQIKATIRYHLTSVRMAIIKETGNTNVNKDVEKVYPCTLSEGMYFGIIIIENRTEFSPKIKNRTTI